MGEGGGVYVLGRDEVSLVVRDAKTPLLLNLPPTS